MNRHLILILVAVLASPLLAANRVEHAAPLGVEVLSRQLRVDLIWQNAPLSSTASSASLSRFEVQRAARPEGPFETVTTNYPDRPFLTDFFGQAGGDYYYRVRGVEVPEPNAAPIYSDWSATAHGSPMANDPDALLNDVEESGVHYFYHYGHPVSGLARESFLRNPDLCATGATGMGLFNLIVGVERGFIPRPEGAARTLKILTFLTEKADRFHGAFSHWINGATGKTIPFSKFDDGANLVETAFLVQGALAAREYFASNETREVQLRERADKLWHDVEWNWFVRENDAGSYLQWHWSPAYDWKKNLRITGFNEAHAAYLLALASPTHPIPLKCYWDGWMSRQKEQAGAKPAAESKPLFFTHYSYLGFDPRKLSLGGRTCFEYFQEICRGQIHYAETRRGDFDGYGALWGITASYGPDGYRAFAPGRLDNGTLAPTAALSSMPYVPEESQKCLSELYQKHGKKLWGPFGFCDAFNFKRDWVCKDVLGIDVGPIAPMIENHRSGLCWKLFMNAKEIGPVLENLKEMTKAR